MKRKLASAAIVAALGAGGFWVGLSEDRAPQPGELARKVYWFGPFEGEACGEIEGDVRVRGDRCFARARSIPQDEQLREACALQAGCRERRR